MSHKPIFDQYFRQRRYENAHFNFTNLFMWRKSYQIKWATDTDFLYVKAAWDGSDFALPPFGADAQLDIAIDKLLRYFQSISKPFRMRGAEVFMVKAMELISPGVFEFVSNRDNFDYVYTVGDLIQLAGRKYHSKKNHINSFKRSYPDYKYATIANDLIGQCIAMAKSWCEKRGCKNEITLQHENIAILEALENFEYLGCKGGVILNDGKVEAFTFGEIINDDTAVIHIEKGDPDIRGIYPVINQEFCQNTWSDIQFINREEDMGIPGLRKAKESYHPIKMIQKYDVTLK